eukprot:4309532-Pyramimonas_sp.AAC.1
MVAKYLPLKPDRCTSNTDRLVRPTSPWRHRPDEERLGAWCHTPSGPDLRLFGPSLWLPRS